MLATFLVEVAIRTSRLATFNARDISCVCACMTYLVNKIPVFSVNHCKCPVLPESFEGVEEIVIAQHEDIFVSHETFERVDAIVGCELLDLLADTIAPPRDSTVETVIAAHCN